MGAKGERFPLRASQRSAPIDASMTPRPIPKNRSVIIIPIIYTVLEKGFKQKLNIVQGDLSVVMCLL